MIYNGVTGYTNSSGSQMEGGWLEPDFQWIRIKNPLEVSIQVFIYYLYTMKRQQSLLIFLLSCACIGIWLLLSQKGNLLPWWNSQGQGYTFSQISSFLEERQRRYWDGFDDGTFKKDADGYYKFDIPQQEEFFYFQKKPAYPVRKILPFPTFMYMETSYFAGSEDYAVNQQSETILPMTVRGKIELQSTRLRYPFVMRPQYFKNFILKGRVTGWDIKIKIELEHTIDDNDNYKEAVEEFRFKQGESFSINPLEYEKFAKHVDFNHPYFIYVTTETDGSTADYEFAFTDNSK